LHGLALHLWKADLECRPAAVVYINAYERIAAIPTLVIFEHFDIGVEFIDENTGDPGVCVRKSPKRGAFCETNPISLLEGNRRSNPFLEAQLRLGCRSIVFESSVCGDGNFSVQLVAKYKDLGLQRCLRPQHQRSVRLQNNTNEHVG
jgi:hypothetical protein